jgi:arginyl-tRNA synthetase
MTIVLRGPCARRRGCPGTIDPNHSNEGPLTGHTPPTAFEPIRAQAGAAVGRAWDRAMAAGALPTWPDDAVRPTIEVERPADPVHGDLATNLAMKLARPYAMAPLAIATALATELTAEATDPSAATPVASAEVAPPGFLNMRLRNTALESTIATVLADPDAWGRLPAPADARSVNVEFVSANPTGPLHVGNARGAFIGDMLSRVLEAGGQRVTREYYFNDSGGQIRNLGASLAAIKRGEPIPDDGYKADYVVDLAGELPDDVWAAATGPGAAVWFRSTDFGDDKDRVIFRSNGEPTYFAADIGYVTEKFSRDFEHLIYVWGADHHGTVARVRNAAEAMGYDRDAVQVLLYSWVRFVRDGQEVSMSKRAGEFITLDELLAEVGVDAARWFFPSRAATTGIDFDIELAKKQSNENPVYYVQYAHARIASILRKAVATGLAPATEVTGSLAAAPEAALARAIARFPEVVEDAVKAEETQGITAYATELATTFHGFYRDARVVDEDEPARSAARLALADAARITLANALRLLGISAPESM